MRKKIICLNNACYKTLLKIFKERSVIIYLESEKRRTIAAELTIELIQEIEGLTLGYQTTDDGQLDTDHLKT